MDHLSDWSEGKEGERMLGTDPAAGASNIQLKHWTPLESEPSYEEELQQFMIHLRLSVDVVPS